MSADDVGGERYQLAGPTDLRAVLGALAIEHVEVDDERTIAIYDEAVLNVAVVEGTLAAARTVAIEVYDRPARSDPAAGDSLIQRFITAVRTEAASTE